MYKFIYTSKANGAKVYSNEPLDEEKFELVQEIKTSKPLWQNIQQKQS